MTEPSENLSFLKSQLEKIDNNIQNLFSSKSDRENKLLKTIQKYNDSLPLLNRKLNEVEFELDKTSQQIEAKKKPQNKYQEESEKLKKLEGQLRKKITDDKKVLEGLGKDSKQVLDLKAHITNLESEKVNLKNNYREKQITLKESKVKSDESKGSDDSKNEISDAGKIVVDKYKRLIDAAEKVGNGFYEGSEIEQSIKFYKELINDGRIEFKQEINEKQIKDITRKLKKYEIEYNQKINDVIESSSNVKLQNHGLQAESQKNRSEIDTLSAKVKSNSGEFVGGGDFFVSFCDVQSVLLCFFVVFFSISKQDLQKFEEFVSTWNDKEVEIHRPNNASLSDVELKLVGKAKELVKEGVHPETLTRNDADIIQFVFPNQELFVKGKVRVSTKGLNILKDKLENLLFVGGIKQIKINGHLNDEELTKYPNLLKKYYNSLGLSVARASSVASIINKNLRFPQKSTIITGYGTRQPIKPNSPNFEKHLNSRIEIEVVRDKNIKKT
jgi:chemotaxis protein MotB